MTTERQLAANRANAKKSTGPQSADGKRRSRRNALRHGLTAETVIDVLESAADYEALAAAINADYRPATNFELQLIARLISLLWRLRRAIAIESGLLALEAESIQRRASGKLAVFYNLLDLSEGPAQTERSDRKEQHCDNRPEDNPTHTVSIDAKKAARAFLRLASVEGLAFERLSRYEASLWRQTVQIVLLLNSINRGSHEGADASVRHLYLGSVRKSRRIRWPPFAPPI